MKRIILLLMAVASICCAFLPMSPYNYGDVSNNLAELKVAQAEYNGARADLNRAQQELLQAQNSFDDGRTFEVYYGDIVRLKELFGGIAGLNVQTITNCDATKNFATSVPWSAEDPVAPTAVKFSITAEDTVTALNIINRMELPITQLMVTEPNMIDFIFLTGEAIS